MRKKLQDKQNQANLELHQMDNNFNERMAEKANQWNIDQWNEVAIMGKRCNSASARYVNWLNPTIMMQGQGECLQSVSSSCLLLPSAAGAISYG